MKSRLLAFSEYVCVCDNNEIDVFAKAEYHAWRGGKRATLTALDFGAINFNLKQSFFLFFWTEIWNDTFNINHERKQCLVHFVRSLGECLSTIAFILLLQECARIAAVHAVGALYYSILYTRIPYCRYLVSACEILQDKQFEANSKIHRPNHMQRFIINIYGCVWCRHTLRGKFYVFEWCLSFG